MLPGHGPSTDVVFATANEDAPEDWMAMWARPVKYSGVAAKSTRAVITVVC